MSDFNFMTDMADERVNTYKKKNNSEDIDGISSQTKVDGNILTTIVDVLNEKGKNSIGKDIGKYITIEIKDVIYIDNETKNRLVEIISTEISNLIENKKNIFVIGLGNRSVTPDCIGPKVVDSVNITRHIIKYMPQYTNKDTREISAIVPGVLGTTGIETSDIVMSIIDKIKPDIVIAIDSLASLSVERLGKTVQISNTGITPGAGVNNKRAGLTENTLGVPVIAIGVPTVVDIATITNEAIDKLIEEDSNIDMGQKTKDERYRKLADVLNTENYIVTPKEIDDVVTKMAGIISKSLNASL